MENCLDRTTMQDLLDEIGPALKDIAARNGVTISCGRARFNPLSGTIELGQYRTEKSARYRQV